MKDATPPNAPTSDDRSKLFVVGLGASAGGVGALKTFFAKVRPGTGAAYAVILHLSPHHDSHLAEVLQTTAPIPVQPVTSSTKIVSDHVYVVPPNKSLSIADGTLTISEIMRVEQRRAPVDLFFRALADTHGSRSVCAVLSGTGPDGSAGLKRVKEYGGLVLAQDPNEAEYSDMPRNAIATGLVDMVLPVAEMPAQIAAYVDRVKHEDAASTSMAFAEDPDALRDVLTTLRVRTGNDFGNYKLATLHRRIARRMSVRGAPSLTAYATLIRQEPDEAVSLMKDLLISVTNFFRDSPAWMALGQRVVPRLFEAKRPQDQVRVWVPGCATGEEAYSIAMLLSEHAAAAVDVASIQVFGTDLDQRAIATARDGLYSEAETAEISENRLSRFFQWEIDGYRVRRELRELVLFAHHNVIKDPPFSQLDLICCRNLLIYLNRAIQERVIEIFHFALRPGAFLFLGGSESPDGGSDLFVRLDPIAHVYQSRAVMPRRPFPITDPPVVSVRAPERLEPRPPERVIPADLHQRMLEEYAPPSVIITEEHNVVHLSERVGRFLQIRGGEPARDLLLLIRPELRADLRTALHQSKTQRAAVDVRGVAVEFDEGIRRVDISVKPFLREGDPARGFILVIFDEHTDTLTDPGGTSVMLSSTAEPINKQLEDELGRVKGQLQATIEDYEIQVEEAKATNEELQATNEELRSAAEELETSKEELQSVNEELTTVNQELKIKIEELRLINNDFQNLINATDIGTIFLDRELRVKFSTQRARDVFNLLDSDIGRPLSDITGKLRNDTIQQDARTVLDRLSNVEREIETDDGRWMLVRVLPYRTTDNHINGVVITFLDISARRRDELRIRQSEERLRLLIEGTLDYAIFTITEAGIVDYWNPGAERMFGYAADEIVGSPVAILFTDTDRAAGVPERELADARRNGRASDDRYHVRKDGSHFFCSGVTSRLGRGGLGFAKIARDLTSQRQAAEALRVAHDELDERVRQRTGELQAEVAGHETAKRAVTNLLHRVVKAQEDERRRIARDLHDHFGQQLTALRLALERRERHVAADPSAANEIAQALTLTRKISRDLDSLAWELRPQALDELGLEAALPRLVTEWSTHVGIPAQFRSHSFTAGQLSEDGEVAFFRIAQEALNNIAKHSHASRADVLLSANDGQVLLVVEDDGVGFDAVDEVRNGERFGLAGMSERAALAGATLEVESTPGRGTSIFLRCPIRREAGTGTGRETAG